MKKAGILISLFAIVAFCLFSSCGEKSDENKVSDQQIVKEAGDSQSNTDHTSKTAVVNAEAKILNDNEGKVVTLSKQDFINNIWDYSKNPESFEYKGKIPCIVDFYADWCRPCKMVAPIMVELAKEYKGKINIYKVNTDMEKELASIFRIQSIPSMLFVPTKGMPQMTSGAFEKQEYIKIINDVIYAQK